MDKIIILKVRVDEGLTDQQLMRQFNHRDIRSIKTYSRSNAAVRKELANKIATGN